jgi:hypothetical protein
MNPHLDNPRTFATPVVREQPRPVPTGTGSTTW